jgi:CO/xanthine dehydrogenase FAD-binding subunit
MDMWNQYFIPENLPGALRLVKEFGERARLIAGGTDLVLDFSNGKFPEVEAVVDISCLPKLRGIHKEGKVIRIGAAVTLAEVIRSDLIRSSAPILVDAARQIAGPQIRNIATIGGNVANASPAADMVPPLLALETSVETIDTTEIVRLVPLERFLLGNRQVDLGMGEILTGLQFKIPEPGMQSYFRKVQPRRSNAIAMLNLALMLRVDAGRLRDVCIAMGAVAPTPVRLHGLEGQLVGLTVEEASEPEHYRQVRVEIAPITDFRASRQYRLRVAQNLVQEAVAALLDKYTVLQMR